MMKARAIVLSLLLGGLGSSVLTAIVPCEPGPVPDSVKTLILTHPERMRSVMGITDSEAADLDCKLQDLADHPRVSGRVVDLGSAGDLAELYSAWDGADRDPLHPARANQVLFGCHPPFPEGCGQVEKEGLHDILRSLLQEHPEVEYLILVGDDRILPFARIRDRTVLLPEERYPEGEDLTDGTSVGQALAASTYLTDDLLGVPEPVHPQELDGNVFLPELAIGRLVETPAEILSAIDTFLDLGGALGPPPTTPGGGPVNKVLVSGYDFLRDGARQIKERWDEMHDGSNDSGAPVNGRLLAQSWGAEPEEALLEHLCGKGGNPFPIVSLNGHATHHQVGSPDGSPLSLAGLDTARLLAANACSNEPERPLALAGSVVYAVGCHGGLPVPGSAPGGPDSSLDLPQTFLSLGAAAYVANSGYGWGLLRGVGYGERLPQLLTEELARGGPVAVGKAVQRAKLLYLMEILQLDPYHEKSLMQWTLFGFPMFTLEFESPAGGEGPALFEGPSPELEEIVGIEQLDVVSVEREIPGAAPSSAQVALPQGLTRLALRFDLGAPDIYEKRNAAGDILSDAPSGCPDSGSGGGAGCYYTLGGQSTGQAELPLQPAFAYDARIDGLGLQGVLWKGGVYEEEGAWVPVAGRLISNGGPQNLAPTPRGIVLPPVTEPPAAANVNATGTTPGSNGPVVLTTCPPPVAGLSGLLVPTGEVVPSPEPGGTVQRLYREIRAELFYSEGPGDASQGCDRQGPELGAGLFGGERHLVEGSEIRWQVRPTDPAGVWRVVVVIDDRTPNSAGHLSWDALELVDDGTGTWVGSLSLEGLSRLTYVLQAVDLLGNVSWLEQVSENPESGVMTRLPLPVEVELGSG